MPTTITYKQGDVVLVDFVFSDESGIKKRPAVVLSTDLYHLGRQEMIIAAITGNVAKLLEGDCRIADWRQAGLLHPSIVTGILRTVKRSMIRRKLGKLFPSDLQRLQVALRRSLAL